MPATPGVSTIVRQPASALGLIGGLGGQAGFSSALQIDATGEKAAFCGSVWFAERTGTKQISRVGFLFGTIVKAGGSGLTVSLQDVLTTAGPMKPDEVQDQTVAIANGNASFASDTWIRTDAFSANRTVAFGENLAVVVEYDGSGRQGSDVVRLKGCRTSTSLTLHFSVSTLKTSGAWATVAAIPNILLEFSDGTFGTILGGFPISNIGSHAFYAGSTPDEYALEFSFPSAETVDAASFIYTIDQPTAANAVLGLYAGTSLLKSVAIDSAHAFPSGSGFACGLLDAAEDLAAATTYRLGIRALGADSSHRSHLDYYEVADAAHWQAHVGGTSWAITSRTDQGAWSAVTATRRPFIWPHLLIEGWDGPSDADGGNSVIGPIAWIEWPRRVP